jgi:hypothetical protein
LKLARNFDGEVVSTLLQGKTQALSGLHTLLKHVNVEALRDEYIDWTLVSILELWTQSAQLLHSGRDESEIELELCGKIADWIALMPISNIWADFSRLETEIELQSLEQFIFDSRAKATYSMRLIESHPRHSETIIAWANQSERITCLNRQLSN